MAAPGMDQLLRYLHEKNHVFDCAIISDANSLFIWWILHFTRLEKVFPLSNIYTNPARIDDTDCKKFITIKSLDHELIQINISVYFRRSLHRLLPPQHHLSTQCAQLVQRSGAPRTHLTDEARGKSAISHCGFCG